MSGVKDHPRRCGENPLEGSYLRTRRGSPPQVRGKPGDPALPPHAPGITPAGAGKTGFCAVFVRQRWDHPRRCGENLPMPESKLGTLGSPPQVRGKPFILKALSWVARITPAGAGKTGVFVGNLLEGQDHPRRCGENAYQYILSPLSAGSPPQVRGKRTPHQTKTKPIGITPAGAGKTAKKRVRRRYTRDHPRGCGENRTPSPSQG